MRLVHASILMLCLVFNISPRAQQAPSLIQQEVQPVQKDAQSLNVLAQMIAATGWNLANVPKDAVAEGNVTRYSGDTLDTSNSISALFKLKGTSQSQVTFTEDGQQTITVVNGYVGAIVPPGSKKQVVPVQSALGMRPNILPFFSDAIQSADPAVSLKYLGMKTINGVLCHGVTIARVPAQHHALASLESAAKPITMWVSSSNWLPVEIDYVRLAADNQYVVTHFSRTFSDYRLVNRVAVAFLQEEEVEGQKMYRTQLNSVQFNVGLTDGDFDLSNF